MQHKNSLARKYFFSIFIVFLALMLVVSIAHGISAYRQASESIRRVQLAQAQQAADRIAVFIDEHQQSIIEVSRLPWRSQYLTIDDVSLEFQRLLKLKPAISELQLLTNSNAELLYVSRSTPNRINRNVEHAINESGDKSSKKTTPTLVRDIQFTNHAFPTATFDFAMSGMHSKVRAEINFAFLRSLVQESAKKYDMTVIVTDRNGRIIAHPDERVVLLGKSLSELIEKHAGSPHAEVQGSPITFVSDTSTSVQNQAQKSIFSGIQLKGLGWWVFVEEPHDSALTSVSNLVKAIIAISAIGSFVVLMLAFYLSRQMSKPIQDLRQGVANFAGGQLDSRLSIRTGDELEELAVEFNSMATQLQDYTQNLEQKVADKTRELELANQHKSEFLANMSHELRTPLNAVIGFSDALKEEYFGTLNDKQREYVQDIAGSGQHLLSLINDILDLSKIEAGKMELDMSVFSVLAAIDNAMVLIRERALRQSVTVSADVAADVDVITGDERKFKQVLINLLTNAVKFTYPNGWVKVSAVVTTTDLVVSVADNGLGIAKEDQEIVFQEFRQLSKAGSAKHEGTGLGLSLTKRIVELHGGRIWLESEVGKGATFTFCIPRNVEEK
jgi:signal transduction histidine kinase